MTLQYAHDIALIPHDIPMADKIPLTAIHIPQTGAPGATP